MMENTIQGDHRDTLDTTQCGLPDNRVNAELAAALQAAAVGIIVTDLQGRVTFLNPGAERLTGIANAEAAGRPLRDVFRLRTRADAEVAENLVELATISGDALSLGTDLLLASAGSLNIEIEGEIAIRMSDGMATGTVITFRDVTSRNREEARRTDQEKIRLMSELAGSVAHELNNRLTVILGSCETLRDVGRNVPEVRDATGAAEAAAESIAGVAGRLMTLSGRRILFPVPVDVNRIASAAVKKLMSHGNSGLELTVALEPGLRPVLADSQQLEEAISDLLRLAVTRMPRGGRLEVRTMAVSSDSNQRLQHTKTYVQVTVADSGPPPEDPSAETLFQPSWVATEGEPAGLGLFAVRIVASSAGGHLWIDAGAESGAKFNLVLPVAEQDSADRRHVRDGAGTGTAASANQPTILLVEDDHSIRIMLRNAFVRQGYRVIEARDGEEALLQADLSEEPIAVLVTDIVMPKMDGVALVRELTQTHPTTRVVLTSGCPIEESNVQNLIKAGAAYVQKPFSQRELLSRVESILAAV